MISGKAGRETKPLPPQQVMDFLTIRRHLVDFGSHFGAHWVLKGPHIEQSFIKVIIKFEKKGVQEGVLKKHDFWMCF